MTHQPVQRIVLIGARGAGKTTVARLIAERLDWSWIDADGYLESKVQRTIREIFEQEGEPSFRMLEALALKELLVPEKRVVATGGGVVLDPTNRARLRAAGLVVWLTADAATLWQRLQADRATPLQRPALTNRGGLAEIEELLAAREPLYRECANCIVDTSSLPPNAVADRIVSMVGSC